MGRLTKAEKENIVDRAVADVTKAKKQKLQERNTAILGQYAGAVDSLNQAIESGESRNAVSEFESLRSKFLATNPELAKEFSQLNSAFEGTRVFDEEDREDAQQNAFNKVRADATDARFIREGMTKEQEDEGLRAFQQDGAAQEKLKRALAAASERRARGKYGMSVQKHQNAMASEARSVESHSVSMAKANLAITERQEQIEIKQGLAELKQARTTKAMSTYDAILNDERLDPAEKERQINAAHIEAKLEAEKVAGPMGSELVTGYMGTLDELKELSMGRLKGTVSVEVAQNKLLEFKAKGVYELATGSEGLSNAYLTTETFKNNPAALSRVTTSLGTELANAFRPKEEPGTLPNIVQGDGAQKAFLVESVKDAIKAVETSENPEKAKIEAENAIENTLRGVNAYTLYDTSPAAFSKVMDLTSSTEFETAVSKGLVNMDTASQLQSVIAGTYQNTVVKTIQHTFDAANPASGVEAVWQGKGIVFKPKAVKDNPIRNVARDRLNRREATEKMNKMASIFNKLIQSGANLQGVSVKQYFEENKAEMLPQWFSDDEGKIEDVK